MKSISILFCSLLALSAASLAHAVPDSSSFKMEGDAAISTMEGVSGTVTENGNVLELKNGELRLNGNVIYKKKGAIKVQMVHKGASFNLKVDGKDVPLLEQNKK